MLQGIDHRLDVPADAAELADRPLARAAVARRRLQMAQGLASPFERRGNLFGIAGDPRAACFVEDGERAEPAVHRLGNGEKAAGVVGDRQGGAGLQTAPRS